MKEYLLDLPYSEFKGGIYNPSIVHSNGEILGIARIRSKEQNPNQIALMFRIDESFSTSEIHPVRWINYGPAVKPEDFRFFHWQGNLFCSHTVRHYDNKGFRMGLSRFDVDKRALFFLGNVRIRGFNYRPFEKNWCFYEHDGELLALVNAFPLHTVVRLENSEVLQFSIDTERNYPVRDMPLVDKKFVSLSTPPVEWDDKHLFFVVHQSSVKLLPISGDNIKNDSENTGFVDSDLKVPVRPYLHYGVLMRKLDMKITAITELPILQKADQCPKHDGITYLMTGFRCNSDYLFGFGESDKRCKLLVFDQNDIDRLGWIRLG